jgi:hypothetical protein
MSTLEYDSEVEKEAIEIVKKRRGRPKKEQQPIIEPAKIEQPVIEQSVIEPIIEKPAEPKPKRERSAKQKEITEKMRQKLKESTEARKKLSEERNIEEDILLKRIKERATKKTIAREIKKKVKQLKIIDSDTENIIDEVINKPIIQSESEDEQPITPIKKTKTRKPRKQPQPIYEYPPHQKPMTIQFV